MSISAVGLEQGESCRMERKRGVGAERERDESDGVWLPSNN